MSDLLMEKNNSSDDSALSSDLLSSPVPSRISREIDTSFSSSSQSPNDSGYKQACDFEAELSHIHNKMIKFKHSLIREINEQSDKFKSDIEYLLSKTKRDLTGIEKSHQIAKIRKDGSREKVFEHRESLLTELFKISHIRTLRHIFISILIIICFQIVIYDLTTIGKINLDFELWRWSFEGFQYSLLYIWLPMKLSALFVVYYSFYFWSTRRQNLSTNHRKYFDGFFLVYYLTFLILLIVIPVIRLNKINVACRIMILMEQVRFLMKSHAFVRSNLSRAIRYLDQSEKNESTQPKPLPCPPLSKYVYFMFAPTLVYRDDYPRTTKVRWLFVIQHFAEVLGSMLYTYCLFDRFCVPVFRQLNVKTLTFNYYAYLISICILPGALIQLMVFFSFLHSWHNAFAEMLRFGDRQFYLDWWNSTSYNVYYRTWNTLVQDWLYTYIYRDLYKIIGKNYRSFCQFTVIFISSVFHEHIFSFSFGFFYPVMFVLFSGFGFICLFIPSKGLSAVWNVFIWISLFTGIGIQLCLFSIEWFARNQGECPKMFDSFLDYLVPRSIICLYN